MSGGLLTLFFGSVLASTIFPFGVEGLLAYFVAENTYSYWPLLITASVGNTLGGIITWWMGYFLHGRFTHKSWHQKLSNRFKLNDKAMNRVRKWGTPALLFSWLPVIGDPLCLAAGYLKLPFWQSSLMIALGKTVRYIALLWILEKTVVSVS